MRLDFGVGLKHYVFALNYKQVWIVLYNKRNNNIYFNNTTNNWMMVPTLRTITVDGKYVY